MAEAMMGRGPGGMTMSRAELGRLLALLVPLGLVGAAIGSQYFAKLYPFEMCYWQRYPHFAAIPLAALAFTARAPAPRARARTCGAMMTASSSA